MNYTVVWLPAAEAELARIFLRTQNRSAVTAAADKLDQMLAIDPLDAGESRTPDDRILLVAPLGIYFRVLPDDRLVQVGTVWEFAVH